LPAVTSRCAEQFNLKTKSIGYGPTEAFPRLKSLPVLHGGHWDFSSQKPKNQEDFKVTPEEKQKIATFRFVVIGDLVTSNLEPGEQERLIGEKIRRKWQIPLSLRTRVGRSIILRWIKLYKDSGNKIESLFPDERNDRITIQLVIYTESRSLNCLDKGPVQQLSLCSWVDQMF
jgi:hypothetical protein